MPTPTWASSAAFTGEHRGYHLLDIVGYSRAKTIIRTGSALVSSPFMLGGYVWGMQIYPNGQLPEDADYITVSFGLIQDVAHPVKVRMTFSFIDEVERQATSFVRASQIHDMRSHSYIGHRWFMSREAFEKSEHLKSDCFTVRLDLIVIEEGHQH
jgi:speckle-type POZ protein